MAKAKSKTNLLDAYNFYINPTNSGKIEIKEGQRIVLEDMHNQLKNVKYIDVGETMAMYTIDGLDGRTDEILEQVIDLAKKRKMKIYPILELLYATGSRIGDIVDLGNEKKFQQGMKVQDIDFKNGFVIFKGAKGNVERITPMPDYLATILQDHIKNNNLVGDDYLFKSQIKKVIEAGINEPIAQSTVREPFNELLEEVTGSRKSGLSLHESFRNGWIESIRSVVDGIPVDNIENITGKFVGHKSLTTTNEYMGEIVGKVAKPLSERKRAIFSSFSYGANKLNIMANNQTKFKGGGEGRGRKKTTKKKIKNIIPRKAPEITEEEIIEDKRTVFGSGKDIDQKVPFGQEEEILGGKIHGQKEIDKAYRLLARTGTRGAMYQVGRIENANAEKAVTLLNIENNKIVKVTNALDENNAFKVINSVLNNKINYANYADEVDSMVRPIMMAALDYTYDPNNLMDTVIKAPKIEAEIKKSMPGATTDRIVDETNWWSNRGLSEYVAESGSDGRRLRAGGLKPEIKLDMDVTRQIYEKLELKAYAYNIAEILDGQLQHLASDTSEDGIKQISKRHEIFKKAMYRYAKQNPESLIAFSRSQNITVNEAVEEIIEAHSGAVQRVEFSSLSSEDLIKIINNNPDVFPDSPELYKKYGKDFIYRARLEPYIQFFADQGVLARRTYIGGVAQNYGSLFSRTLKDTSKTLQKERFTKAGIPEKTTRKWLFDFRSTFWHEAGLNLAEGRDIDPKTNKMLPLFDLDEFELDTGQNQVPADPKPEVEVDPDNTNRLNKIKPRGKPPIRWGALLTAGAGAALLPQTILGKVAVNVGTEAILHATLVDTAGQGQGIYNNRVGESIKITNDDGVLLGELYPNVSRADVNTQLAELPDAAKKEIISWTDERWEKEVGNLDGVNTSWWRRNVTEELKDWARYLGPMGASLETVSPVGYNPMANAMRIKNTEIPDPATRMLETIEEVDTEEGTSPDLVALRQATTKDIVTDSPDDLFRKLGNVRMSDRQIEYLKKQGNVSDIFFDDSGELKRDEDKRNRVKQLQYEKEMNEILSTNPKENNDAVNEQI